MVVVDWHAEAIADLDRIADYISRNSPDFAPLFVRRIFAATDRLATFPRSRRIVPELGDASYREVVFQNYRIVYRALRDRVVVIGVIHGAMDMARQARRRRWELN